MRSLIVRAICIAMLGDSSRAPKDTLFGQVVIRPDMRVGRRVVATKTSLRVTTE